MKTQETPTTKAKDIKRHWHEVDAQGKILGRIATEIALKLTGKNKPYFVRHLDCGDYVVVVNAKGVKVTGNKLTQKIYTNYSGYPGGLRSQLLRDLLDNHPEEVIKRAVMGMLPKNKLRDQLTKRLYIYKDEKHEYKDKFKKSV
jgi:large subunit ribosomal protein L13